MDLAWRYLKRYLGAYGLGISLLIAVNLLGAYIPQLVKEAINKLQALALDTVNDDLIKAIIALSFMIVGFAVAMAITRTASRYILFGLGRQVEFDLKRDIFNQVIKQEPEYFSERKAGDLISVITNDVQSFRAIAGFAFLNVFNTIIAFTVILPMMFGLNAEITTWFLCLIPLILLAVTAVSGKLKEYQEQVQEKLAVISNFIEQNLSGIHIIKSYAQEEAEIRSFAKNNESLLESYLNLIKTRTLVGPLMKVIASLGFVLLLYLGGQAAIEKSFSLGDFAAYTLYIERLIWPVATIGWIITVVFRAQVSAGRIQEVLKREPRIKDTADSVSFTKFKSELRLNQIAADGAYIAIPKGSFTCVVGSIASGKTTLARKLLHLQKVNQNEFNIDSQDLSQIKLNDLRSVINLVPQENFLFSTSVAENISYACELEQAQIEELAKAVCLHDEILKFSEAYSTTVGEKGVRLSGGQRQRVAIARALAINPDILILDDALSSVDNDVAQKIWANIREHRVGKTTIFITHKLSATEDCDQILVMDKFKLIQQGKFEDLSSKPGLFADLYSEYKNKLEQEEASGE